MRRRPPDPRLSTRLSRKPSDQRQSPLCSIMIPAKPVALLLFLFNLAICQATSQCPAKCACSHNAVICTGQSLTTIPKDIPPDTVRLDLQENKIAAIRKDDFSGLLQLKILYVLFLLSNMLNAASGSSWTTRSRRLKEAPSTI